MPTRAGGSVEDHDGAADDVAAPESFECVVNVVQPDGNDVMLDQTLAGQLQAELTDL
jgi:hypothetical protein